MAKQRWRPLDGGSEQGARATQPTAPSNADRPSRERFSGERFSGDAPRRTLTPKRVLHQFLTFLTLFLLLKIARFPYSDFIKDRFEETRKELRTQGVLLEARSIDVDLPNIVRVKELSAMVGTPVLPIPFFAEQAVFDWQTLQLLLFRIAVTGELTAYDGLLSVSATHSLWDPATRIEFKGDSLRLDAHPLASANGLGGVLSIDGMVELQPVANKPQMAIREGSYRLHLDQGSYRGGHKVKGIFALPAATDVKIDLDARQNDNQLTVHRLECYSSLGSLQGTGKLQFDERMQPQTILFEGAIELTPDGVKSFGGYL
ncbi:MAG: type II secretion system protein GspN, partial [Bdellovibrionales bacterium]|nr:type II secretion system protein GspN [Bdellovibrionales bacterium]